MSLDLNNLYLMVALDYYEYMKMPLTLFPKWIKKQYNLENDARDGIVFLEVRCAFGASHRLGFWPTNYSASALHHTMDITSVATPLISGSMLQG